MSEQYIVSARKYRPGTFHSVVGQKELTATLRNSIRNGRLAHAYLFCGPRGVGKTSCARIFAKAVNCLHPTSEGEACGECESCKAIDRGNSFNLMELDAASNNGVDKIRELTDQVNVPPQVGKYRIFIIDEVHMLSSSAFNAFLKTLEEPPSYAIFILATTEKHKVIPTILSRCQIYDFKRITLTDIVEHLQYVAQQEGITADPRALGVIARKADGAMRDALSIFDQVAASSGGNLTYEAVTENLNVLDYDFFFRLIDDFRRGDVPDALIVYKEIRDKGFDSLFFVSSLMQHVRDLMVAADPRTLSLMETPPDVSQKLAEQASTLPLPWYYSAMGLLNDCDYQYRTATNKQLLVELTLIRLCQLMAPQQPPFDQPLRKTPMRDITSGPYQPHVHAEETTARGGDVSQPTVVRKPIDIQKEADAQKSVDTVQTSGAKQAHEEGSHMGRRTARRSTSLSVDSKSSSTLDFKREPFTDEQFQSLWQEFAANNPALHILVSAMQTCVPERVGDVEYRVVVQHPAQVQAFEMGMANLLEFFRSRLNNDFLTIRAEMDASREVVKPLTPQELLKKVADTNPKLVQFLKGMDPELV